MGREGGRNKQVEGEERPRRVWGEAGGYAGWLAGRALCHGATWQGSGSALERLPGKVPAGSSEVAQDSKPAGMWAGRKRPGTRSRGSHLVLT